LEVNHNIEDNNSLYFYVRSRKRKLNNSTDFKDMPPLPPPMEAMEIMLDADYDYMPDCHDSNNDSPSSQNINWISFGV
jgi:hypothetical protein